MTIPPIPPKFKKRINIESADSFILEYQNGKGEIVYKTFLTYKSLEQFHSRQEAYLYIDLNRFAMIDGKKHKFMKLRSPFVFADEMEFLNKVFNEKSEA